MSSDRWKDVRVERAAVLAVERSILDLTELVTAEPASDFGIDLLAFRPDPFAVTPIQVKGAQTGLTAHAAYALAPIIVAYVIEPLSNSPRVCIMSGREANQLPARYVERGGTASDYDPGYDYRWSRRTALLDQLLTEHIATTDRWNALFEENRAR